MPDGAVITFKYDPFGRRIEKSVNGVATRYFYDNEDILFEYDETGNVGNKYVHGLGIDEPLALVQDKNTYYYHADGLGSIVALTDSSAKIVQTYEYDSFGNLHDLKNAVKQPYTFTGREYDRETGLYYYRARYYDAEAGRFTSFDPILHQTGGYNKTCSASFNLPSFAPLMKIPKKFNPYSYVANSPINLIDPQGLSGIISKLLGEVIAEILGMGVDMTIGGLTGAACASDFCTKGIIPKTSLDTLSECMSVFAKYPEIPTGASSSADYVTECEDKCYEITHTKEFKDVCCAK